MSAAPAGLVRLPVLLDATGYSRSGAYQAIRAQLLPAPVKLGRASRWPGEEVQALAAAIKRGAADSERRALVRALAIRRSGPQLGLAGAAG